MDGYSHAPTADVVEEMASLKGVDNPTLVVKILSSIYELALRSDVTPRTVADRMFVASCSDEKWKESVRHALTEATG